MRGMFPSWEGNVEAKLRLGVFRLALLWWWSASILSGSFESALCALHRKSPVWGPPGVCGFPSGWCGTKSFGFESVVCRQAYLLFVLGIYAAPYSGVWVVSL